MNKFYTDEEIIELLEDYDDYSVASLVRERFKQKDSQREFISNRLRVAESALGAMYLQELIDEEIY